MRRISILLLLACLSIASARAQFAIGPTAGINVTHADGDGWHSDAGNGWYAGLKLKLTSPILGVGADVAALYSVERFSLQQEQGTVGFIAFPVNLRWEIKIPLLASLAVPYLVGGPQLNYCVDELDLTTDAFGFNERNYNAFRTKDASWRLNVGLGVTIVKHLEVGYTYGLPLGDSVYKSVKTYADDRSNDIKSGTHRVGLTWYF